MSRTVQPSGNALQPPPFRLQRHERKRLGACGSAPSLPRQDNRKELESIGIAYDVGDKERTKTGRSGTR